MNLSDVVRKQTSEKVLELTHPLEKTDFMNMGGKVQPAPALTEVRSEKYERGMDNLIRGLVDLLPTPGSDWSLDDRAKWFRLAAGIFDLGYKTADVKDREIIITLVAHAPAKRDSNA
jgi:hypothetical protein